MSSKLRNFNSNICGSLYNNTVILFQSWMTADLEVQAISNHKAELAIQGLVTSTAGRACHVNKSLRMSADLSYWKSKRLTTTKFQGWLTSTAGRACHGNKFKSLQGTLPQYYMWFTTQYSFQGWLPAFILHQENFTMTADLEVQAIINHRVGLAFQGLVTSAAGRACHVNKELVIKVGFLHLSCTTDNLIPG